MIVRGNDGFRAKSAELEETREPRSVTLGEIVVDRHDMTGRAIPREGDSGDGGDQALAFTRCHFGETAATQREYCGNLFGMGEQAGLAARGLAQCGEGDTTAVVPTGGASTTKDLAAVIEFGAQFNVRQRAHMIIECHARCGFIQQRSRDFLSTLPASTDAVCDRVELNRQLVGGSYGGPKVLSARRDHAELQRGIMPETRRPKDAKAEAKRTDRTHGARDTLVASIR